MNVCISRPSAPNEIIDITAIQDITIENLSEIVKYPNKSFSIRTPFYRERLEKDTHPFIEYPELIIKDNEVKNYPIPDYCIIIHELCQPQYSLFVLITTQLEDIEFPPMEVEFTADEYINWKAKDLLERCIQVFGYNCSNSTLLDSNQEPVSEDSLFRDMYNNYKKSHLTFKCTVDDSSIEKIQKRKYVVEEIFNSEITFAQNVQILHDYFRPAFEASEIFDRFQLKLIFREIDPILSTHLELILQETKMKIGYSALIGPLFLNFVDHFKVAIPFVTNFKRVDDMVQKKRSSSKHAEKKLEEINSNSPKKEGGDFLSFYITPVQRYPRYTLLIRDLDKCTPSFHPDKSYLALAQESLIIANREIDETSQRVKQLLILGEIQKTLLGNFSIIQNDRNLIDRKKVTVHKKLKVKKGIIYLFNDSILIVKKGKKKRKPIFFVNVDHFRFCNCLPSNDSILINIKNLEVSITFENYEERASWVEHLNQARTIHLSNIYCDTKFIKWTEIEMGKILVPLMNLDGCYMNNNVYFFGGNNSSLMPCSALIEYNLNSNSWILKSSPVQPRVGHTITTIQNKIYVCFGLNKNEYFQDIWEFDGNRWKVIVLSIEIHLAFHTTTVFNNNLIVFGGKNENGFSNVLYKIDPTNGNVTVIDSKDCPSGRANHAAVALDNKLVVIGGETGLAGNKIVGDVVVFDFNQNCWNWMKKADIEPRIYHKAVLLKGYIFVIGGNDDNELISGNNIKNESPKSCAKYPPNECIDPLVWEKVLFKEFGNAPLGISRFAIAATSRTSAITYGGIDSKTKMPFASSWMFDMEEGFYQIVG